MPSVIEAPIRSSSLLNPQGYDAVAANVSVGGQHRLLDDSLAGGGKQKTVLGKFPDRDHRRNYVVRLQVEKVDHGRPRADRSPSGIRYTLSQRH